MKLTAEDVIKEYLKSKKYSLYENFCIFSSKILTIKLSEEEREKEEEAISFSRLRIPPGSNMSAAIIFFIFSLFFSVFLAFFGIQSWIIFSLIFISLILTFLIYYYPYLKSRIIRASAASEVIHAIVYMVISLKQVPNLEKAVLFTASSLKGIVGQDFKEAFYLTYIGKFKNIKEALDEIVIKRWSKEAREFCEALKILISYSENPYGAEKMLDEAVSAIMDQTYSRLEKYSRSLKLPSMIILALGIILPLLASTILLLFSIILPNIINFSFIAIFYDIFLPTILLLFIFSFLQSRPLTSSYLELGNIFQINFGNFKINISLLFLIFTVLVLIPFINNFINSVNSFENCLNALKSNKASEDCLERIQDIMGNAFPALSIFLVLLLPLSILYLYLRKYIQLKDKIEKIEKELPEVVYQVGHEMKRGYTLEISISKALEKYKKFEIKKLFEKLLQNLYFFGNLKTAIFDEKRGILNYFPSSLLRSFFNVIVESYQKGYLYVATSMILISENLKRVNNLQDKIEDITSDVVTNLKFIVTFLTPFMLGVIISLSLILSGLFINIASKFKMPESEEIPSLPIPFFDIKNLSSAALNPANFILALGIYVIEIVAISSLIIVGLEKGFDNLSILFFLSKTLIISLLIFVVSVSVSLIVIEGMIVNIIGELQF